MERYYNLKAINSHRKNCATVKAYSKARKAFVDTVEKGLGVFPEHCPAH